MSGWLNLDASLWLVALPAAGGPLLLAWWGRRWGRNLPAWAVAAQCLAVALVVLGLARPRAQLGHRSRLPYLLAVDASGSVRGQEEYVRGIVAAFPPGVTVERFDFAAQLVGPLPPDGPGSSVDPGATAAGPVLRMIDFQRGAGRSAVLASDGRFTDDWTSAARRTGAGGAELLIVPLDHPSSDARIADLTVRRGGGPPDRQVQVAVTVVANAPLRRALTIARVGADAPLLTRELNLLPEVPAVVGAIDETPSDSTVQYLARLSAGDPFPENDSASTLLLPRRQKLLAVGLAEPARRLLADLPQAAEHVSHALLPDRPEALSGYSAVVVSDPTGEALSPAQRRALAEYVASGGGAVVLGTGPNQSPADLNDPFNRVLPLLPDPFRRRPLRLSVLLDRSGSMSLPAQRGGAAAPSQRKFDLAAEAVLALKDHLTPRDSLAVIAFSDAPETLYDSGDGPGDFARLADALRQVRPGGSTRVTPAIRQAISAPAPGGGTPNATSRVWGPSRTPLLLIVSDLRTEEFAPREWADNIRRARADLAVVAIADAAATAPSEPPLRELARQLGAAYVEQDDLAGLARVFAALVRAGRGSILHRQAAGLVITGPLFDSGLAALPDVQAYVLSAARSGADLLARTAGGDPVLARMPSGLGRSVALAVPVSADLNAAWQADPSAGQLLAGAVRWVMRGDNDPRFDVELRRRGERLNIRVTAGQDARPMNLLALTANVLAAPSAGQTAPTLVALEQQAPGLYHAAAPVPGDSPAAVTLHAGGAVVWHGTDPLLYAGEYRRLGADMENLRSLADLAGGSVVRPDQLRQRLGQSYAGRMTPLGPGLLLAGLLLMLAEWCFARVTRR